MDKVYSLLGVLAVDSVSCGFVWINTWLYGSIVFFLQLMFFRSGDNPCEVLDGENGLLFVHQADGRATGDAFVLFSNEDDANKALSKHRQCISTRYIELFKSTTAEVQQVRPNRTALSHRWI